MKSCIENKPLSCSRMRYLMNTFCEIKAEGKDNAFIEQVIEEAFLELKRIEGVFSRYLSDSPISELNRRAYDSLVEVDSEVFGLIIRALEFSRSTYGAFDITVGAAIDLWRSSESKGYLPTEVQMKELQINIGHQNIILDFYKQTISFTQRGMRIDLGALAKGYALDSVVAILKQRGIEQAQINLGGNIYIINNQPQTITIRNPLLPDEVITAVTLANSSISTSASYERFFTIGDRKFSHLLNPLTGYPVESDILSASAISPDAALADALSTAILVLGFKRAKELLKEIEGVEAVVMCKASFGRKIKIYNLQGGQLK